MKRSEMEKVIGSILVFGVEGLPQYKKEKYKDLSLASIILSEIEEQGMMAPVIKEPCFCSTHTTCPVCDQNYFYQCQWEKE